MIQVKKGVLVKRSPTSHKGQNGKVLIIGGSEKYTGAPLLAGIAALRAGCDIVTIVCPEKVGWAINSFAPDLITLKFECQNFGFNEIRKVSEIINDYDVILIGNGLGTKNETMSFVSEIIKNCQRALVIDADALKGDLKVKGAVLTPHFGEYQMMLHNQNKAPMLERFDLEKKARFVQQNSDGNIILLKGPEDIVASDHELFVNKTGNEGMTVAGTGDVLAGIVASLIAQGNPKFESSCYAAHINGICGDICRKKYGIGFLASDLLEFIPEVTNKLR